MTTDAAYLQLVDKLGVLAAYEFLQAMESFNNPLCWIRFEKKKMRISVKGRNWKVSSAGICINQIVRRMHKRVARYTKKRNRKVYKGHLSCFYNVIL